MADIEIKDYSTKKVHTFKHGKETISFKSDHDCTLTFAPDSNCFGTDQIDLRKKVEKIANVKGQYEVETTFTISGNPIPESPAPEVESTYSIEFGS